MDPENWKVKGRVRDQDLRTPDVLVIGDDKSTCEACRKALEEGGLNTAVALNGSEGMRMIREVRPSVVLVDLKTPGVGGIEVPHRITEMDPRIVSIVMSRHGTIDSAVESMKMGAFDFFTQPFDPAKLVECVRQAIKLSHLRQESTAEATSPSRQDVLLKGLSVLSESYSAGFARVDFLRELGGLDEEARDYAESLGRVRKREKALLDLLNELRGVDEIIKKHDYRKSSLIQVLLETQAMLHWLPRHVLKWTSERLNVPLADIYSIAAFYEAFSLKPEGAHSVHVCMGTACHVRGAPDLLRKTSALLGIEEGQTDDKQMFTLKTVHCLGCCALSPVVQIDDFYLSNPSLAQLKKVFKSLEAEEVRK